MRKLFSNRKKNSWTQMHTISLQPITFHKLEKKMVFDNQEIQIFPKKTLLHIFFLERFSCRKKTRYGVRRNIWSLFGRLSFLFPQRTIHFFFKFFQNIGMICIDMFRQCSYTIGCVLYD